MRDGTWKAGYFSLESRVTRVRWHAIRITCETITLWEKHSQSCNSPFTVQVFCDCRLFGISWISWNHPFSRAAKCAMTLDHLCTSLSLQQLHSPEGERTGMKVDHVFSTVVVLCMSILFMHGTTGTLSKKDRGKKKKVRVRQELSTLSRSYTGTLFLDPPPPYQKSTLKILILRPLLQITMHHKGHYITKHTAALDLPLSQRMLCTIVKMMTILDDP